MFGNLSCILGIRLLSYLDSIQVDNLGYKLVLSINYFVVLQYLMCKMVQNKGI